ncbi:GNAT family N-acetyltransferase, cg3035/Rv0428c family [Mycobacterium sp. Marseille-P9652]|uniref:GNAT family N-acetyltransferase, cg3035/Rv0428c family n=1 Tax=Mycobacterium sp. Marseille-P9652 TaxID=2654950 RepID=UPI0012E8A1A0|nr:GNAT family N-acetyltransferase [Mycobacterium sp. Marseille-P9652]
MISWPPPGTRVTVRYRREPGSVPPLTDAVGHLLEAGPVVRLRTKTGAVAEFAHDDVVALRVLTDAPVRTSDIRALEHAAAAASPGVERAWVDGWLLRSAPGAGLAANSAMPLDISATLGSVPAIVDWYERRGVAPRLAVPDRLLPVPPGLPADHTERVLVRDVAPGAEGLVDADPDGSEAGATVTDAPDGTRWVGLSVRAAGDPALAVACRALLAWGAARGATRGYLVVPDADSALAEALGFRLHHRRRYFPAMGSV